MKIFIGRRRRDNKYPVEIVFAGQPNGFGGLSCGKSYRKIWDEDTVNAIPENYPKAEEVRGMPYHLKIKKKEEHSNDT